MAQYLNELAEPGRAWLLAIESATARASVALCRGDEVVESRTADEGEHHAERLLPMIDEVLGAAGLSLEDVEAYAVSIGPGAFTSLRIGLATVKGLAFGGRTPVAPVSTLEAIALESCLVEPASPDELIVPVLDARRGDVYAASYRVGQGGPGSTAPPRARLEAVLGDHLCTPASLAERLVGPVRLVGEGAEGVAEELLAALGDRATLRLAAETARWPTARATAQIGLAEIRAGRAQFAGALVPVYLRQAQAEEARLAGDAL